MLVETRMAKTHKTSIAAKDQKQVKFKSKLPLNLKGIINAYLGNKVTVLTVVFPMTVAVLIGIVSWDDIMNSETFHNTFCKQNSTPAYSGDKSESSGSLNGLEAVLSGVNMSYYDWIPMKPAHIYDPVDDRHYPYHVLKALRPSYVRLPDRDISPIELKGRTKTRSSVRAYLLDDLLSEEECHILMGLHEKHIRDLSEYDPIICFAGPATLQHHLAELGQTMRVDAKIFTKGTRCVSRSLSSKLRRWGLSWSHGTAFYPGESHFSRDLAQRIDDVIGLTDDSGSPFRVVSYPENTGYKMHTDCTSDGSRGKEDRFATVLIYLNDVAIGGHTQFPELGISVKPKRGRALVFTSMTPDGRCDPSSSHVAQPVIKGHKYILQRWYFYQNFPGIEKRPPVPPIPERHLTQAHVSCDEYTNGSCRWYDSWTYDVLTHY